MGGVGGKGGVSASQNDMDVLMDMEPWDAGNESSPGLAGVRWLQLKNARTVFWKCVHDSRQESRRCGLGRLRIPRAVNLMFRSIAVTKLLHKGDPLV